jgi:signal transduction histidine kinase
MRVRSLRHRLALIVLSVGLLAIVIDSGLLGALLNRYLVDQYGNELARRTDALARCCMARSPLALLALTERAAISGEAGTATRFALVLDASGRPVAVHARWTPPAVEQELAGAAGRHALKPPGAWTTVSGMIAAQAPVVLDGQVVGTLILATDLHEVYRVRGGLLVLTVWSSLVGLVVATGAGLFAARSVTRPIWGITAAARAITAGRYDRRAAPVGPDETVELARAFNTMVDEVQRQRQVERDLLANVSHELAAPLGIVRGYAGALADGVLEGEAHRESALRAIAAETGRLGRLVGDLLDLALMESGQATLRVDVVQVGDLLADVRDRMAPAAEAAGVALAVQAAGDLPALRTDCARLEGVLVNLVTNAVAHTPAGGRITLVAAAAPEGVSLSVRDTGKGIAPADLPRIFERFYRGDKSRDRRASAAGGVGLGLAICRQVITALGGTIRAESVPGQGSTFTVLLPIVSG